MNLEKLKVSFRKSCLYRLRKLTTPFRSSLSQSKQQHGSLLKVADLFVTALSGQDLAKSHDNDVFVFDSSSAILKMERREDEPKSTAHEHRFFRRAQIGLFGEDLARTNPNYITATTRMRNYINHPITVHQQGINCYRRPLVQSVLVHYIRPSSLLKGSIGRQPWIST